MTADLTIYIFKDGTGPQNHKGFPQELLCGLWYVLVGRTPKHLWSRLLFGAFQPYIQMPASHQHLDVPPGLSNSTCLKYYAVSSPNLLFLLHVDAPTTIHQLTVVSENKPDSSWTFPSSSVSISKPLLRPAHSST